MKQLLTHSRQNSFKTCRRRHWYEYQIGLRREVDAKALRMGSAYHAGLEVLGKGGDLSCALLAVEGCYAVTPETVESLDWDYEWRTVAALLTMYQWWWNGTSIEHIETEKSFQLSLLNPTTGHRTPIFDLAGKIDGIVRLEDGRTVVMEHKLLSDSLDSDAELWRRLQIDHQITMYVLAARAIGHDVSGVLYNATRKPTIKPTSVPYLDSADQKIVFDSAGWRVMTAQGKPRQTGDAAKHYALQTRPMTGDEWQQKLLDDIGQRPDYYFSRHEVPRLDGDLEEYRHELWSIQLAIREAQKTNRWYRTCTRDTCKYCPYFDLCTSGYDPQNDPVPEGFVILENTHPELEEISNGNRIATEVDDAKTSTKTAPAW